QMTSKPLSAYLYPNLTETTVRLMALTSSVVVFFVFQAFSWISTLAVFRVVIVTAIIQLSIFASFLLLVLASFVVSPRLISGTRILQPLKEFDQKAYEVFLECCEQAGIHRFPKCLVTQRTEHDFFVYGILPG